MDGDRETKSKSSINEIKTDLYINPFVHRLNINDPFVIIKTLIFSLILLPIRVICIGLFLITAWSLACIGLCGLTPEDLKARPITGWRRNLQHLAALSMRALFAAGSFNYIKYKGIKASPKEAPILCVAPHSSYVDAVVVVVMGPPSIVAKAETAQLPFFGKLINFTQPIYVLREDSNSRHNTIKEIVDRANSTDDWSQIVIFPEGTCTNRSALITFKPGAFYPGVPVQPVLLRYPNELDSFTWTWDGPGIFKLLWLTLAQLNSVCEIEFLPVYKPSSAEKADPKLFARNVRNVMARALGVPVSDLTYDDCAVISAAQQMRIPHAGDTVVIDRLQKLLWPDETAIDAILEDFDGNDRYLDLNEFLRFIKLPANSEFGQNLFNIMKEKGNGRISIQKFLLCICYLQQRDNSTMEFLFRAAKIYGCSKFNISNEQLFLILQHTGRITREENDRIYASLSERYNYVKYEHFEDYALAYQNMQYKYLTFPNRRRRLKEH